MDKLKSLAGPAAKATAAFLVPGATFAAAKYGFDLTDEQVAALTMVATALGVFYVPNTPRA